MNTNPPYVIYLNLPASRKNTYGGFIYENKNNNINSLANTKLNCIYVDTVGKNTKASKERIAEQLKRDREAEQ